MGLFRKSELQLLKEEELLQKKVAAAQARVKATRSRDEIRQRIEARKAVLKGLKNYNRRDSRAHAALQKFKAVKARTSPHIRKLEAKIKKNAPALLNKLGEAAAKSTGQINSTKKKQTHNGFRLF